MPTRSTEFTGLHTMVPGRHLETKARPQPAETTAIHHEFRRSAAAWCSQPCPLDHSNCSGTTPMVTANAIAPSIARALLRAASLPDHPAVRTRRCCAVKSPPLCLFSLATRAPIPSSAASTSAPNHPTSLCQSAMPPNPPRPTRPPRPSAHRAPRLRCRQALTTPAGRGSPPARTGRRPCRPARA